MATRKARQLEPDATADRHVAITNLGQNVARLARMIGEGDGARTDSAETNTALAYALGQQIDKAIRAGVKAQLEGRQTTRQVQARLDATRKAVNRALARMVGS
jgi:hypothetical protein